MQELFSALIEDSLSVERLAAYRRFSGDTSFDALLRYFWNTELSSTFYAPLQHLEVALRNAMHTALSERYDSEFWFDKARLLDPYQAGQVVKARKRIPKQHQCNSGKIVAELEFGFWTALLYKRYQPTLVPPLLKKAFSNVTDIPRQERRAFLSDALGDIRRFRNRLFHHEPIWYFSDLCQKHNTILQLILWLSPSLFKVTQSLDRFHDVYRAGTLPFKAHLLALSESGFLTG